MAQPLQVDTCSKVHVFKRAGGIAGALYRGDRFAFAQPVFNLCGIESSIRHEQLQRPIPRHSPLDWIEKYQPVPGRARPCSPHACRGLSEAGRLVIHLGHSLLHLLDTESARRGLTRADMVECFRLAISENFRRRGKIVVVTVDDSEGQAIVTAVETVLTGGPQAMYREMHFIPPFSPEMLAECIEGYVASRLQASPWLLVETTVVQREADHYVLEVAHSPFAANATDPHAQHQGQLAVLPTKAVAQRDSFKVGEAIWVVAKANVRTSIDGGHWEAWRDVQAPLVASRTEAEFLAAMAFQLLNEPVQARIHTDRGILIFPEGKNVSALMNDNGRYRNMLQRLTGLERLVIARRSGASEIHKRLNHAIREVSGLKYASDYKLGCEDPTKLPTVYIRAENVKRLVGVGGHNVYFIKCVCGFKFEWKVGKAETADVDAAGGGDGVVMIAPAPVGQELPLRSGASCAA